MRTAVYVAIGAAVGGVLRYYAAIGWQPRGSLFPVATLLINITGSFALGFLARAGLRSAAVTPELRAGLTTGLCGGYTTFSTFSLDLVRQLESAEYAPAAAYLAASVGLSIVATFLGIAAANALAATAAV